jgi:hypothetical protein
MKVVGYRRILDSEEFLINEDGETYSPTKFRKQYPTFEYVPAYKAKVFEERKNLFEPIFDSIDIKDIRWELAELLDKIQNRAIM